MWYEGDSKREKKPKKTQEELKQLYWSVANILRTNRKTGKKWSKAEEALQNSLRSKSFPSENWTANAVASRL